MFIFVLFIFLLAITREREKQERKRNKDKETFANPLCKQIFIHVRTDGRVTNRLYLYRTNSCQHSLTVGRTAPLSLASSELSESHECEQMGRWNIYNNTRAHISAFFGCSPLAKHNSNKRNNNGNNSNNSNSLPLTILRVRADRRSSHRVLRCVLRRVVSLS